MFYFNIVGGLLATGPTPRPSLGLGAGLSSGLGLGLGTVQKRTASDANLSGR